MKRKDVLSFAEQLRLGPQSREYRKHWLNFQCPWATTRHSGGTDKSKGFGISCDDGHSTYFCLACHVKGSFASLAYALGKLRDENLFEIGKEIERAEVLGPRVIPKQWEERYKEDYVPNAQKAVQTFPPSWTEFSFPSAAGHPYLAGRGIGATTAIRLGLRYDEGQRRILFPVYSREGRFAGFSGRAIDPPSGYADDGRPIDSRGDRYLKVRDYLGLRKREFILGEHRVGFERPQHIYGYDGKPLQSRSRRPIIVSEGLFDYAWLAELGYFSSLNLMGSWFAEARARRIRALGRPLILFLDNDIAGFDAIEVTKATFWGHLPLFSVEYPSDAIDADPSTLPRDIVHKMLRDIRPILTPPSQELLTKYQQ